MIMIMIIKIKIINECIKLLAAWRAEFKFNVLASFVFVSAMKNGGFTCSFLTLLRKVK